MMLSKMIKKNIKGQLMLESLIVYSVTLFLLFLVLAIFSTLFQRWNLQIIANESATRIAQTYRYMNADTVTGEITKDMISDTREYRYVYKKTELESAAKRNLSTYALSRISKTTFTKEVTEPKMDIVEYQDSLARRHIKVSITGEYRVPFGTALSYFGYADTTKYTVESYAECVDIIDYINTVDYVDNQTSLNQFDSKFVDLINSVLNLFDNILGD